MYFYRLFNCAALKTEGDTRSDGSIAKLWRLCTVQQIEGLKTLIRIFPMVYWHIFKYSSSNPREHDNPPSSNHGPSSWATFQNSNWVYGSHTHHICCHLSYSNRSLPLSFVAETDPSVSNTS